MTTTEALLFLEKARWHLSCARVIAAQAIPEIAAREAYYAAFHAAEAYIFEGSGKIAKSHRGVHSEFSRLAKDDPSLDNTLLAFLGQAYAYKSIADYEVGPRSKVAENDARDLIEGAARFVAAIENRLTTGAEIGED